VAKRKKSREQKKRAKLQRQKLLVSRTQLNVNKEVQYIIGRAQEGDGRCVTLGKLVFFSTPTGDAWMLDPEDEFALCLATDGSPQPVWIMETEGSDAVDWDRRYFIDGDVFTAVDKSGRITFYTGYPIAHILEAVERALLPQQ
jgi:hypothetical protein